MMIAADDPLIWSDAAGNLRDYVIDRFDVPIECHFQMHPRRPRSNVIRNRERSAPLIGSHRPRQCGQQRLCVAIRNRQHRNLRDALGIFQRQTLGIRCCADPRGQRISWTVRSKIHHAAALHAIGGPHRPDRKNVIARVAVVLRFGINEAANRAMLGRNFRLHSAPRV